MADRTIFEALADDTMAAILELSSEEARSADELADQIEASESTVYRRIERLVDAGLLDEQLQLDKHGDHYHVYRTAIERVEARIDADGIDTRIERREDGIDRFVRLWEDIRGEV